MNANEIEYFKRYKPYFPAKISYSQLGLRKSMRFRKHMLFRQLLQSADLLQVLKQKPTGPAVDSMKWDATLVEPSEVRGSQTEPDD